MERLTAARGAGRAGGPGVARLPGEGRPARRPAAGGARRDRGPGLGVAQTLAIVALALAAFRYAEALLGALDVFADYHAYYRAAANLRAGADLYAEGRLLLERNSYDYWAQTDGQYVYPPLLALLLLPLTALDIGQGGVVWLSVLALATAVFLWVTLHLLGHRPPAAAGLLAGLLVLGGTSLLLTAKYGRQPFLLALATPALVAAAGLAWAARRPGRSRPFRWSSQRADDPPRLASVAPAVATVLAAAPLLLGLRFGQVDLVLLLLTTLALLASLRGRDALAGVALGAAAAVKPALALYGLFYLRKRRWPTLGAAALTGLLLGLGPFALLGPGALAGWLDIARYFSAADYLAYPSNQSLRGFLVRAFAGGPRHVPLVESRALGDALSIVAAGGALILWWRLVGSGPVREGRAVPEYALTAVLLLFAAPLSEDVHYVALLLPLAVLADRAARGPASVWQGVLAVGACLYFIAPWLDGAYDRGGMHLTRLLASGAYLYGLVLVGAALAWLLRDDAAASRSAPGALPRGAPPATDEGVS